VLPAGATALVESILHAAAEPFANAESLPIDVLLRMTDDGWLLA